MNRRSFFGFAAGGLVAAPVAMLAGERPSNGGLAKIGEIGPEVASDMLPKYEIRVWGADIDARIRETVQRSIQDAFRTHQDSVRRVGFGVDQAQNDAMRRG